MVYLTNETLGIVKINRTMIPELPSCLPDGAHTHCAPGAGWQVHDTATHKAPLCAGSVVCMYMRPAAASLDKVRGHYGRAAVFPGLRMFRNTGELCEKRSLPKWLSGHSGWQQHAPTFALLVDISDTLALTYCVRAGAISCYNHASFIWSLGWLCRVGPALPRWDAPRWSRRYRALRWRCCTLSFISSAQDSCHAGRKGASSSNAHSSNPIADQKGADTEEGCSN